MANTYVDYVGSDGTGTDGKEFAFSFPYIKTSHVVVEINQGPAGGTNKWERTTAFTVSTSPSTRVVLDSTPNSLWKIRVLRDSDANTGIVDFANGSVLTETELDNAYNHNRYLAEEAEEGVSGGTLSKNEDGQFNADALRIENVAAPDSDDDAANKSYVDTAVATEAAARVSGDNDQVSKTGDTMSGALTLPGTDPTDGNHATRKTYVDAQIAATLATGVAGGPIDTANIADNAVETAKIADDAVTADKLAHTAVTPGSYTNTNLTVDQQGRITAASSGSAGSAGTVTSVDSGTGLTGGPITTSGTLSIANGGVDTTQLADNAVTAAKIENNAVTAAKISATDSTFSIDGSGNMGLGIAASSAAKLYISGTGGNTFLAVKSDTMAAVDLEDSGAALNQKHYQMVSLDGAYEIRQMNDNLSIKATPLQIDTNGDIVITGDIKKGGSIYGGVSKYSTGWSTSIPTAYSDVTYTHSLGTDDVQYQVYVRDSSGNEHDITGGEVWAGVSNSGCSCVNITSTQITIRFFKEYLDWTTATASANPTQRAWSTATNIKVVVVG